MEPPDPRSPSAVAADATGVYVVGHAKVALPDQCRSGFQDAFVQKYSAAGVLLWSRQFSGTTDGGSAHDVAAHSTGIYVAGASGEKALLAKLETTQPVVGESGPWICPGCVVNAASYIGGRISPGEIVTVFGSRIGPPQTAPLRIEDGRLATALADTHLLFNGIPAPLIFVSANQINAIVPSAVAAQPTAEVEVEYQGIRSNKVTMPVAASRPGVFTLSQSGSGHAVALNEDGSINSSSNPARSGSIIVLYATGEGLAEPSVDDGVILGSVPPKPKLPVSVSFLAPAKPCPTFEYCQDDSYLAGEVLYAGGAPELVAGLLQVNVRVPPEAYGVFEDVQWFTLCVGGQCSENQVSHVFLRR